MTSEGRGLIELPFAADYAAAVERDGFAIIDGVIDADTVGRLAAERLKARHGVVTCNVAQGGVMLMRPLLLHASSAAADPSHRRVLHLEYSAADLPGGLRWHDA